MTGRERLELWLQQGPAGAAPPPTRAFLPAQRDRLTAPDDVVR